jgi:hypothetical protein
MREFDDFTPDNDPHGEHDFFSFEHSNRTFFWKCDYYNKEMDGARGTMFFSSYPRLNDTREVWFIHGGYLYEVTTFKQLDSWLGQIMQTWKFI